jgi:hypothetical protein
MVLVFCDKRWLTLQLKAYSRYFGNINGDDDCYTPGG